MSLTEIPRVAWTVALNDFSAAHEDWLVSLDVWTPEVGSLREIDGLRLIGVSADRTGDGAITVTAAAAGRAHAGHTIQHPTAVTIERDEHGIAGAVHIESSGGAKTTLRLSRPPGRT
jgi:Family of unknown function (DUF5335)